MSAGWVAGSVRAQAMARRRLGCAAARTLAASESLAAATESLARSPYGRYLPHGAPTLAVATRAVAETLVWNLRVLAGWLPAAGAEMLRVLAGWFEIANVDEHMRALAGDTAEPPFRLGTLTTVWPLLHATGSPEELRAALAASPWRDPGGSSPRDIQLGMRLVWAERVGARVESARTWAYGASALLVARERAARDRPLPEGAAAAASRMLGAGAVSATSLGDLTTAVPARARWALAGVVDVSDLWLGEAAWWRRVRTDAAALVAGGGFGPGRVVGAAALLAADAWLVRGALELAARPGTGVEVFDAVA
jgi:hypothetical protein